MTPEDQTSPKQPLDAEERALAERLARIGPHGEPSPALDSKILSAAHAAVGNPSGNASHHRGSHGTGANGRSSARHGRRARWPLGLSIAASMVLAIGLAWQMRPLPEATPAYRPEADSAMASAPVETKQAAEPAASKVAPAQPQSVAPPSIDAFPAQAQQPAPKPIETRSAEDAAMAADEDAAANRERRASAKPDQTLERMQEQSARVTDHASERQPALSTPPPPAPPAPPAPAAAPALEPASTPPVVFDAPAPIAPAQPPTTAAGTAATTARKAAPPTTTGAARAASRADNASTDKSATTQAATAAQAAAAPMENTGSDKQAAHARPPAPAQPKAFKTLSTADAAGDDMAEDMPAEVIPPATADSPVVRDAWLARIRSLAAQGRTGEARASLREFVQRYPRYLLPADLHTLQDTAPTSTTVDKPGHDGDTPDP